MADIVTGTVSGQVDMTQTHNGISDIRREQAVVGGGIVDAVKTAGWHNSDRTGTEADRIVAQDTAYFISGQQQNFNMATQVAAMKASSDSQFAMTLASLQTAAAAGVAATALEGAKTAGNIAASTAQLAALTVREANDTRALINALNNDALNRQLIERNAEIVAERDRGHYWHGQYGAGQFAAVSSQLNALGSQLQETRQGMVNFGSMTGVGQTSTSNNA